jgi:hypothetical protein
MFRTLAAIFTITAKVRCGCELTRLAFHRDSVGFWTCRCNARYVIRKFLMRELHFHAHF